MANNNNKNNELFVCCRSSLTKSVSPSDRFMLQVPYAADIANCMLLKHLYFKSHSLAFFLHMALLTNILTNGSAIGLSRS